MLFNSFTFLLFLPAVFLAYWIVFRKNLQAQNMFILWASYLFYGWWDWRFMYLLFISSLADFLIGGAMGRTTNVRERKAWLWSSLVINLGILGVFKYYNFFIDGLAGLLSTIGFIPHLPTLQVILPVGISFYTFQTISYSIDIHRGQLKPTRDPIAFFAFVGFFPQLVAGPIERARDLLPQFEVPRQFDRARITDGLRQILWGFFKKIVVADSCAPIVDRIFNGDVADQPGITLFFGAFFFAFQIYGDFSGYSDIAIGTARLFGFNLSRNFAYPYFARNISEFWRRWHITLSTWFRDYVYLPLGGWRSQMGRLRNILITFGVSGLWHGANWTFVAWGGLHGLYHVPLIIRNTRPSKAEATLRDLPAILMTFTLVTFSWIFFRTATLKDGFLYVRHMVSNITQAPGSILLHLGRVEVLFILLMLVIEWRSRGEEHAFAVMPAALWKRWAIYLFVVLITLANLDTSTSHAFIYFRF